MNRTREHNYIPRNTVPSPKVKEQAQHLFFQPKLTVGPADDVYEREADAMADKVMRMEGGGKANAHISTIDVQRKCKECEEEDRVQRKEAPGGKHSEAPSIVGDALNSGGTQLDVDTRGFMETRFGYDFSKVKIHTDGNAVRSAQSINALAYTSGSNIVFNEGQYEPGTVRGRKLLAHELTHVIQQSKAGESVQRYSTEDCSATQLTAITAAVDKAKEMLRNAVTRLNASPVTANTQTLFGYHFGAYADWRRDIVVSHLNRDLNLLNTWDFTYECDSDCTDKAFTYWIFGDIHLCPPFFTSILNEQAETLIHELHHLDPLRGHLDLGYHGNNRDAGTSWLVAVNNADSYSELCQDLYEQP